MSLRLIFGQMSLLGSLGKTVKCLGRNGGVFAIIDVYWQNQTNSQIAIYWWNFAPNEAYVLHPPPPSPMPQLLQEMASGWCHQSVCLVLPIDVVYVAIYSDDPRLTHAEFYSYFAKIVLLGHYCWTLFLYLVS